MTVVRRNYSKWDFVGITVGLIIALLGLNTTLTSLKKLPEIINTLPPKFHFLKFTLEVILYAALIFFVVVISVYILSYIGLYIYLNRQQGEKSSTKS